MAGWFGAAKGALNNKKLPSGAKMRGAFDNVADILGSASRDGRKVHNGISTVNGRDLNKSIRARGYRRMAYGGALVGGTVVGTSSGVRGTSPRSMGGTA